MCAGGGVSILHHQDHEVHALAFQEQLLDVRLADRRAHRIEDVLHELHLVRIGRIPLAKLLYIHELGPIFHAGRSPTAATVSKVSMPSAAANLERFARLFWRRMTSSSAA
jgi:hypothetical protein